MSSKIIRQTALKLHGLTINLQFKLVKNITLRIKENGGIFLTAPVGMSISEVQQFLESKEQWLRQKLQLVLQAQQKQEKKYSMGELPFDGQHVWLWGKRLPARFLLSGKKHGTYEVEDEAICFYYRSELSEEARCAFVEFFYKQEVVNRGGAADGSLGEENGRASCRPQGTSHENALGLLQRAHRRHQSKYAAGLLAAGVSGIYCGA